MSNNKVKILILFVLFLCVVFSYFKQKQPLKTQILKVIEADEFYVDLNLNNKIDDFEHVKLKHVNAFVPTNNQFFIKSINSLGLTSQQALKNGYLARTWAKENLTDKEVYVFDYKKCKSSNICRIDIKIGRENLEEVLLKNGLAFPSNQSNSRKYDKFFNIVQVKNNTQELQKLKFLFLNLRTNVAHKLDCPYFKQIAFGEIFLEKELGYLKDYFCKFCFKNNNKTSKINILKSKNVYYKSVSKKFGEVELFLMSPLEYSKPNNSSVTPFARKLINLINLANRSIYIAIYGIDNQEEIINALNHAKNRGVEIKIVADDNSAYPNTRKLLSNFNVVYDTNKSLMHNKFFIFDNKIVMSGSTNISSSGSGGYNGNVGYFIENNEVAQIFTDEFNKMYNSKFSTQKQKSKINKIYDYEIYFSPQDDIYENAIKNNIQNAKKNICISAFFLTHQGLIDELILAHQRGVEVKVILDALGANNFKDRIRKLRNNNISTIVENWGGKNHEKTILIDNEILIIGSANFSKSAFYKNDENIVIFHNPQMAKFYFDYYVFLFNSIDKKYLSLIPRAESFESKNSCYDGIDNNFDGKIDLEDDGCKTDK